MAKSRKPSFTVDNKIGSQFTIEVNADVHATKGFTPGAGNDEKLRLIIWLGQQGLVDHVDYEVCSNDQNQFTYWFKDPNTAMLFKLAWA